MQTDKKSITILGSTGSIGTQTIETACHLGLKIDALAANSNSALLEEQLRRTGAKICALADEKAAKDLKERIPDLDVKILAGKDAASEIAAKSPSDTLVNAIIGFSGLAPTVEAIKSGKNIAIANKETLVAAGELVMPLAREKNVSVLPIDSEHCAIHECLRGAQKSEIKKLIITGSGGPFFGYKKEDLQNVTPEMALKHPNWNMGKGITVYSSTLVNKGLELIEAMRLFDVPEDKIEVIINRQSIVHSLVEFADGSVMAQLATPDMRLCIQYALTYPLRVKGLTKPLDLASVGTLNFYNVDNDAFPSVDMARRAVRTGGINPCVYNASNETCVDLFLQRKIKYTDIFTLIDSACKKFGKGEGELTLEKVIKADAEARKYVKELVG
ncbi:MAG: 1-deoxy-D-xylulose-5-phosphate reductoisomerase [Clostridia bacterium]|nr:1-deoxy-D-xylulose-5-phosphate reductoisomerase [Clostridia bacterium]